MSMYTPEKLVSISRYQIFFPTLSPDIQRDIYSRMAELIVEEKQYCDKGNTKHMAQILTSIAMYEVLQKHGWSEENAYKTVSEEMWKFLDPSGMQKAGKEALLPAADEEDRSLRLQEGLRVRMALHLAQGRPQG